VIAGVFRFGAPGGIEPSAYRLGGGFESNSTLNFNGKSACFQAFSGK